MKQKPIVPETCDADLEMRFGTPQQVAAAYVDAMSTQELLKALRQRRRVLTNSDCICAGSIAVLGCCPLRQLV